MNASILVVDDETDMETLFRQQFRRDLRAGRFDMQFASSAQQALTMIEGSEREIILVLSDINMPGMNGLELLSRIKVARPDLPVVMVTAYGDAETRRRTLAGGAEGLLPKPIDFALLRAEVEQRLEHRGAGT